VDLTSSMATAMGATTCSKNSKSAFIIPCDMLTQHFEFTLDAINFPLYVGERIYCICNIIWCKHIRTYICSCTYISSVWGLPKQHV